MPSAAPAVLRRAVRSIPDADASIRRLESVVAALALFPPLGVGWTLATGTVTGLGAEPIAHGLGRVPSGYLLVSSDAYRPTPGLISADVTYLTMNFGGIGGSVTLLVW